MAVLADDIFECLNLRARFTRRILEIHMKFALYHAVIQLAAFVCRTAVATFKERVRAENILLHRRIFRRTAERRIKLLCLLLVEQPLTVGRIGEQDTAAAVIALRRVRLLEEYRACDACLVGIRDRQLDAFRVDVAADNIKTAAASAMQSASSRACCHTFLSKQLHFSASKRRSRPGSAALRDHRSLDGDRARTAERIEERLSAAPACELDHCSGERLAQRARALLFAR